MRVASGSYTGTGLDNRNIAVAFQPDVVIIKGNNAQAAVARTSTMTGDFAKPVAGATALTANTIQALQTTGFQVGTDARVNTNAITYNWVAIRKAQGTMSVSSYTGNALASRSITGLGYSPEAVMVFGATAVTPALRVAGMTTGFAFDTGTGIANSITALGADGFTLGDSTSTNTNAVVYHYVSWNEVPGLTDTGSYTGTGVANRSVTGTGFTPTLALVRSAARRLRGPASGARRRSPAPASSLQRGGKRLDRDHRTAGRRLSGRRKRRRQCQRQRIYLPRAQGRVAVIVSSIAHLVAALLVLTAGRGWRSRPSAPASAARRPVPRSS